MAEMSAYNLIVHEDDWQRITVVALQEKLGDYKIIRVAIDSNLSGFGNPEWIRISRERMQRVIRSRLMEKTRFPYAIKSSKDKLTLFIVGIPKDQSTTAQ